MKIAPLWILLFACCSPADAGESAEVRAARYYAAGLERPLLQLRAGAALIQACADRLRKACSAEQRKAAAGTSALTLLDELSLFPQRLTEDPTAGISRRRELEHKMSETSAALMREAGNYDRELFARFGATLIACPDDDGPISLESLEALQRVNYSGFQGIPASELAQTLIDETNQQELAAEQMRKAAPEECRAARKLGEYLMELMNSKLQPWSGEHEHDANAEREFDFDKPKKTDAKDAATVVKDRELAHAVAGNFVTVVATELHLIVFPESEARIKAIAEAQGF